MITVAIRLSRAERRALDYLVGKALLHEATCQTLLKQETRYLALAEFPVLSKEVRDYLASLPDLTELADFAAAIYNNTGTWSRQVRQ